MQYEEMVRMRAQDAPQKEWSLQQWKRSPALCTKTGEDTRIIKYMGQKYDTKKIELVENGWNHDHCFFCWQSMCNCGGKSCQPEGYTDGDEWICKSCHQKIVVEEKSPTTN